MCGQPSKLVILPLTLFTPETSDRFDEGPPAPLAWADSNGDSNSSNHRQALATGDSA